MALVLFGSFIAFLVLGIPISIALGLASVVAVVLGTRVSLLIGPQMMFSAVDSFPLMAIPFFILAGNVMAGGGISKRLVRFASALVGAFTGGLALVAIFACMFFAAISGSSPATTAAIGSVMVPNMLERGYSRDFSSAVVAAGGTIGVVIPPSIPMVLYGVIGGVSIGELFLGGFGPGILMGLSMMAVCYYVCKKRGYGGNERVTLSEGVRAFLDAFWAILMPVIILGGIYSGIFTPTEAAAVAVVYGLLVGLFIYKELKIADIPKIFFDSAVSSATVMLLIATANFFGWFLVREQIPQQIAQGMLAFSRNPYVILFLFNVLLLIVGTFLNTSAAVILLTPILLPVLTAVGIDPVLAGVVMVVNLAVGMITPPVGLCLFVACNIGKVSLEDLVKAIMPLLVVSIADIFIITYVPQIVLFLPRVLMH